MQIADAAATYPAIPQRVYTPLKVAFLTGTDSASTRMAIEAVCRVADVVPVAALLDVAKPSLKARFKNLRRNVRRNGFIYVFRRALNGFRCILETWAAARIAPPREVDALLRAAFPERNYCMADLARRYEFPLYEVENLNSPSATECLRAAGAHLGIVISGRILKRSTFSIPELGCINLHKGKVPDYRGMPPGFWELYENAPTAGVTIHFVDDGLDTGDIVTQREISIHTKETVHSLRKKLDIAGADALARAVSLLRGGTAERAPQPPASARPRTKPTLVQERQLAARAPHLRGPESDLKRILKTMYGLVILGCGGFALWRVLHAGRAAIVLYHRVNDVSDDELTADTRAFAQHLVTLRRYYRVVPSSSIVTPVRARRRLDRHCAAIHFDDCYRDVYLNAAPLLKAAGMPATVFVASGFVDTDRVFEHDADKYPHRFENLRSGEIRRLKDMGFEIGAHTVNHVDLGQVNTETARYEVKESKRQLEDITESPVTLFSFPYGKRQHVKPEIPAIVADAGFAALFSAHGGWATAKSNPYDIPRIGVNGRFTPMQLLMELEGLSFARVAKRLRGRRA